MTVLELESMFGMVIPDQTFCALRVKKGRYYSHWYIGVGTPRYPAQSETLQNQYLCVSAYGQGKSLTTEVLARGSLRSCEAAQREMKLQKIEAGYSSMKTRNGRVALSGAAHGGVLSPHTNVAVSIHW